MNRPKSLRFSCRRLFNYGIGIHLIQAPDPKALPKKEAINPKDNHISFQVILKRLAFIDPLHEIHESAVCLQMPAESESEDAESSASECDESRESSESECDESRASSESECDESSESECDECRESSESECDGSSESECDECRESSESECDESSESECDESTESSESDDESSASTESDDECQNLMGNLKCMNDSELNGAVLWRSGRGGAEAQGAGREVREGGGDGRRRDGGADLLPRP
jgi:hypothetical protein